MNANDKVGWHNISSTTYAEAGFCLHVKLACKLHVVLRSMANWTRMNETQNRKKGLCTLKVARGEVILPHRLTATTSTPTTRHLHYYLVMEIVAMTANRRIELLFQVLLICGCLPYSHAQGWLDAVCGALDTPGDGEDSDNYTPGSGGDEDYPTSECLCIHCENFFKPLMLL